MTSKIRTIEWKFRDIKVEYPSLNRMIKITSPADAYEVIKGIFPEDSTREHFIVLWLGSSNKPIGFEVISIGNLDSSIVHPRETFRGAIVAGAASIILAHNHPSGNVEPSPADIQITKKLEEAGKIVEIRLFDHLVISNIIGEEKFTSFVEKRLL